MSVAYSSGVEASGSVPSAASFCFNSFDITAEYAKLKNTKVLYVNSKTDKLFDIALSPGYVSDMRKAGVDVTYVELPSNKGHMASHADAAMWAPILAAFMKAL